MIVKKILPILLTLIAYAFLVSGTAHASEGQTNLQSVIGDNSTCNAKSALMTDNRYTILITCKDLIYPPTPDTNAYIVWATPSDGDNPVRLGALGFGRAQFRTPESFSNLFVTRERVNSQNLGSIRTPGTVVMRGNVAVDPTAPVIFEEPVPAEEEIIATPAPRVTSSLLGRIGTGVAVTIIAIIVIVVMLVIVKPFK